MAYFEVPTRLRRRHRTLSARLHPRARSTDATRPACRVKLERRPHVLRVHQPPPPIVGPAAGGSSAPAGRRDTRRSAVRPAEDGARHGQCTWRWRVRGGGRTKARSPAPILDKSGWMKAVCESTRREEVSRRKELVANPGFWLQGGRTGGGGRCKRRRSAATSSDRAPSRVAGRFI